MVQSTGYTGPDRRQPISGTDSRPYVVRLLVALVIVLAVWCVLAGLVWTQPEPVRQAVIALSRAFSGALLLAAAALRFATWRVTGTVRAAWSSVALAVAGFAFPVVGMISLLPGTAGFGTDPTPVARGLVEFALIGMGGAALLSPAVVSRIRPVRIAAPFLVGCLAIAMVIVVRGPAASPSPSLETATAAVQWTTALLWSALAGGFLLIGHRHRRTADRLLGLVLAAIAVAEFTRAALGREGYSQMLPFAGGQLCLAFLAAGVSALCLWQLQTGRGTRLLRVAGDLHDTKTVLAEAERDQARRLHDARSAILALSGAARLLSREESAAGVDPEALQRLMTAELHRLGSLLEPEFRSADRSFRPADVIEPLVLAHRLAGARIETATPELSAVGRPEATASAVANILSNARTHAPGCRIWITVAGGDTTVNITIADDGPGIRPAERPLVVQYGVRGTSAARPGSGIGLAAAAQAMSDQGGTLRIRERPGGGTMIILTLRRDRRLHPALAPLPTQRHSAKVEPDLPHYARRPQRPVRSVPGRVGAVN